MPKSNETETNVTTLGAALDSFHIEDMAKIPLDELRQKCSFLINTTNETLKVGVTFVEDGPAFTMEVSMVRCDSQGKHRTPLSHVANEFDALLVYATVGQVARRFTQRLMDWGAFKEAISVLAGDIGETEE